MRQKVILPELTLAMNGDWVDTLHDFYANEGQLFLPPDESEDAGSSSALSDDDPSHKLLNEGEEIPDLPLQNGIFL
jgi:hypothetical protein